jgi:hypothetical protein
MFRLIAINFSQKSPHFSLLSSTSPCELSEREVTSPSYLKVVRALPITTKVVSSNPAHGKVYSIQHYVIKFVSDLRQVCGFLQVLRFYPPIKLTVTI